MAHTMFLSFMLGPGFSAIPSRGTAAVRRPAATRTRTRAAHRPFFFRSLLLLHGAAAARPRRPPAAPAHRLMSLTIWLLVGSLS